jgi:hypothetical protein
MFIAMAGFYFLAQRHTSSSAQEHTYMIEEKFEKVRKVMMKKDSLEYLASYQHGQLLDQEWDDLYISSDRLLTTKWNVDGQGWFVVRVHDEHAGELILRFNQTAHIDKDWLESTNELAETVGPLKEYKIEVRMDADGDRTKVWSRVSLTYERRLPESYKEYMDTTVEESVIRGLQKSKEAIQSLVAKYTDKRFVFPIRRE